MRNFLNHQQRTLLSLFKFGYKRSCFDTSVEANENSSESFAVYAKLSRLVSWTSNIYTFKQKSFLGSFTFSRKLRSWKRVDKWNVVKSKPKNHLEPITTEVDFQMRLTQLKPDISNQWKTQEKSGKQFTFGIAYDWLRKRPKFMTNHRTQEIHFCNVICKDNLHTMQG